MKKYLVLPALLLTSCNLMTRQEMQKQDEQKQIISTIQKTKADTELKYSDIQNDIRVVAGRVDALDHAVQTNQQASKQDVEALRKLLEAQNEKIKLIQEHIDATEMRLTAAINAIKPGATTDTPLPAPSKVKEVNALEEANNLLEAKEFKKAIVKFQHYIDKNPKNKNVAEATYKIGLCFTELGLKKDAKEFYKDVIDNYPSTSWAKKAKYRISQIK